MAEEAEFDVALILGTRVRADGGPSASLAARVAHGVALYRAGRVANLLMSGGPHPGAPSEAEVMADLARAARVPPARVHLEPGARNTRENIMFSQPIIAAAGWRRVVVISEAYHLPRALLVCRRHGLDAAASAAPQAGPLWWRALVIGREGVAYLWYWFGAGRGRE